MLVYSLLFRKVKRHIEPYEYSTLLVLLHLSCLWLQYLSLECRLRSTQAKLRLLCLPLPLLLHSLTVPQWFSNRLLLRPLRAPRAALRARPPSRPVCRVSRSHLLLRARRNRSQRRLWLERRRLALSSRRGSSLSARLSSRFTLTLTWSRLLSLSLDNDNDSDNRVTITVMRHSSTTCSSQASHRRLCRQCQRQSLPKQRRRRSRRRPVRTATRTCSHLCLRSSRSLRVPPLRPLTGRRCTCDPRSCRQPLRRAATRSRALLASSPPLLALRKLRSLYATSCGVWHVAVPLLCIYVHYSILKLYLLGLILITILVLECTLCIEEK